MNVGRVEAEGAIVALEYGRIWQLILLLLTAGEVVGVEVVVAVNENGVVVVVVVVVGTLICSKDSNDIARAR